MSGRGRFGGGRGRFHGGRGRGGGRGAAPQPSRPPPSQPLQTAPSSNAPPSWSIYFPELLFSEDDRRAELVATLARFFGSEIGFELIKRVEVYAEREVMLKLDYTALKARADIPDLFAALEMAPSRAFLASAPRCAVVFNSLRDERVCRNCRPRRRRRRSLTRPASTYICSTIRTR